jgi:hypothetical protein
MSTLLRPSAFAVLVAATLLAAAACGTTPSTSSPAPTATASTSPAPTATTTTNVTPAAAAQLLRKATTGTRPLLIPNAIPDSWRADVKVESAGTFTVTYREPAGAKSFTLMVAAANPPLPGPSSLQSHASFHGDTSALYQVADRTVVTSDRFLIWVEPGCGRGGRGPASRIW